MIVKLRGFLGNKDRRVDPLRRALTHTGGAIALVALLAASTAGVSYAYWTSQAAVSTAVQGGSLAISTNFAGLSNFSYANKIFTANGSFTVTNTTQNTTRSMPVSAQLNATVVQTSTPAADMRVSAWPNTVAACSSASTPSGAVTGTWSTIGAVSIASLAPGSSATICVRVVDLAYTTLGGAAGAYSVTPRVTATIMSGPSWAASAASTAATVSVAAKAAAVLGCKTVPVVVDGATWNGIKLSWTPTPETAYYAYFYENGKTTATQITSPVLMESNTQFMQIRKNMGWPNGNDKVRIRVSEQLQQSSTPTVSQWQGGFQDFVPKATSNDGNLSCS